MFNRFLALTAIALAVIEVVIVLIMVANQRKVEINLITPLAVFWVLLWQVKGRQGL